MRAARDHEAAHDEEEIDCNASEGDLPAAQALHGFQCFRPQTEWKGMRIDDQDREAKPDCIEVIPAAIPHGHAIRSTPAGYMRLVRCR
jgi:hypothetical protein